MSLTYYYCPGTATSCTTNDGNAASQVIGQAGNATQAYTYDGFGRLSTVTEGSAWSRTYGYDRQGNQWVGPWTGIAPGSFTPVGSGNFNAKNQLMIQGSHYDDAGNQDAIGGYGMTYDEEGRLATLTLNGVTTTMTYDGEGRRVKKQDGTARTTVMTYGIGGELAQEYETGGAPAAASTQYVAVDHLGSTRMVFDSAANAVRCLDYIPFGEEIPQGTGARAGACWGTAAEPRVRFTGKERDVLADGSATGLDYFGARYFSGAQGRFTSPDPLMASGDPANPQSWNRYSYVLNNPLRFIDPTGEIWVQANGGWDWADECPQGGTCRETVAQAAGNTVTVYGANSRDDISTYQANANGVVNVADIANNIYADFTIGPQRVPENYLSPTAAAALFNVADLYKQRYPSDSNLVFTGGSAETGLPGVNPRTGRALHESHQAGANIDLRYMGPSGRSLVGDQAAALGDVARNQTIINLFRSQNAGLGAVLTGAPSRYGTRSISERLRLIHLNHMHFQRR